jgi:hypothetical protein
MSGAWLPIWIIGAPFIAILVLSAVYKGGSSASTNVDRDRDRGNLAPR